MSEQPEPFKLDRLERGRAISEGEIDTFIADWQTPLRHGTAPAEVEALEVLRDALRQARAASPGPDLREALAATHSALHAGESCSTGLHEKVRRALSATPRTEASRTTDAKTGHDDMEPGRPGAGGDPSRMPDAMADVPASAPARTEASDAG